MSNVNKIHIMKQKQEENICDICGAPNALIRDRNCLGQRIEYCWENNWFSGFTCQKCIDEGKELGYVNGMLDAKYAEEKEYKTLLDELEKLYRRTNGNPDAEGVKKITNLLDELEKRQKDRDQLATRFIRARNDRYAYFRFEYGPGEEDKYCQICGCDNSYLCVVQSTCDNKIHEWDHLSGWFCFECVTFGKMDTYIEKELSGRLTFMKEWQFIKEKYEFFESILNKSQFSETEIKSYLSSYKHRKALERKKTEYDRRAEYIMCDRSEYDIFEPVMVVIESAKVGDPCVFCDETCGKEV